MTAIVETLFLYAVEKNFHPYLKTAEHNHYVHAGERAEMHIRQLLPKKQRNLLEELRQSTNYCISIKEEAAFQAGLAIGLELSRL